MPPLRLILGLGLLQLLGPLAIDMYLPALPAIQTDLRTSVQTVQASLTLYMIALGVGQLVFGALADQWGRKLPLLAGLLLFGLASAGCALADRPAALLGWRMLQGLGACVTLVVPRAMVRDLCSGTSAVRLMSTLILLASVSPLLAPLAGSLLLQSWGWRSVFWASSGLALLGLLLALSLPDTLAASRRHDGGLRSVASAYRELLVDTEFLRLTLIVAAGMAAVVLYLQSSSFILIGRYRVTPAQYSVAFASIAAGYFSVSQLAATLARRWGSARVARCSAGGFAGFSLLLLALCLVLPQPPLALLVTMIGASFACLGLLNPLCTVLALDRYGHSAGSASAMLGLVSMLSGPLLIVLAGDRIQATPLALALGLACCAGLAWLLAQRTLGRSREAS